MESRGKKLVTLALNQQLADKISNLRKDATQLRCNDAGSDNEYLPDTQNSDSSCSDEILQFETINKKTEKISINVLSNIIIREPSCTHLSKSVDSINQENAVCDTVFTNNKVDITNISNPSPIESVNVILNEIIDDALNCSYKRMYTKSGELRKRKIHDLSLKERKRIKLEQEKAIRKVKPYCENCKEKCYEKISNIRQVDINTQFWNMPTFERHSFIINNTSNCPVKRKTTGRQDSRRSKTFLYTLKDETGINQNVCKKFFLATLGYTVRNDRILRNILNATKSGSLVPSRDKRCKQNNSNRKIDRKVIVEHIESFQPAIAHYRREHAPLCRYLPSDISIKLMYEDFKQKHPHIQFSYYLYREVVTSLNISFSKLGHEECWQCEKYEQHKKVSKHLKEQLDENCEKCKTYNDHWKKYTEARQEYQKDAKLDVGKTAIVSVDLQKVIMLPRCDMYKEIIFTPRIIAFNESFVPVGNNINYSPTAVLWHEAIAGRCKEDIISAFYAFLLSIRDTKQVILWLDNCSAQNKNWSLYCFFIFIINSPDVLLENLTLKYFEPGHSFMAADSFHHLVEKSLKRQGKVYDFEDYISAVQNALSRKKVNVINMNKSNFYMWNDYTSQYKLKKIQPRPYLHEMVEVSFVRGKRTLFYKKEFSGNKIELNFLNAQAAKQGISKPMCKIVDRGISKVRKNLIISKLMEILPQNRLSFWKDLPTTECSTETRLSDED